MMVTTTFRAHDKPIAGAVSGSEQLQVRARQLAAEHRLATTLSGNGLLDKLQRNARVLQDARVF